MLNKISSVVATLMLVGMISVSCNSNKSSEAYLLKMRLRKGDKFAQDLDMSMKMSMRVMEKDMNMNMGIKGGTAFEVTDTAVGSKELSMTYTKMDMKMEVENPDGRKNEIVNNDINQKLTGKTVRMRINDKNEITEMLGFEDIMWGDSTQDPAVKEQLKEMFSKEQMNSLFGTMFQMYPSTPVRVGDTWKKETDVVVAGINMKMTGNYTLEKVRDGVAYVNLDGKYTGKGTMKQGGVQIEMNMNGSQKGTINIGVSDGYVKDSQLNMDIDADMTTMGQKVPMTIKGYYIMKATDVK